MSRKTIKVGYLARVEGEAALKVSIRDGEVRSAELNIFEPPRFFEGFLRGRHYSEVPDITARICGICPVAYQMSSVHAMESALGIVMDEPLRQLRRLLYCGEWIESHGLHVYMLHAPDFLGYDGAVAMAADHADAVRLGLDLKKCGNEIVALLGGREIHPINVRVGGFYKLPDRRAFAPLVERFKRARDAALETVRWVAGFEFPDCERDYDFVALRHERDYPFSEGRIVSAGGLDICANEYEDHFAEEHVAHSNALHSHLHGNPYLVGPLARYSLNFDRLTPLAREAACEAGLGPVCNNPYRSIIVRSVEILQACDEALSIMQSWQGADRATVDAQVRAGEGAAATEAPRGLLYHRYRIDDDGMVVEAKIVPPTSQNQPSIEQDLKTFIGGWLDLPDEALRHRCEQTVRNYDPCISCATHFLTLEIDHDGKPNETAQR